MKELIIVGASGFGREVAWLVERINAQNQEWQLLGFLDDNNDIQGKTINSYPVLGTIKDMVKYRSAYYVCAIGSAKIREKVIDKLSTFEPKIKFATLIDPSVEKSDSVQIGEGSIICAQTILTVNIKIGKHVIINLDCTVGHDVVIKDYVTLYPSVNVSGMVTVGCNAELGTGAQIIQGKKIGDRAILGAGAVVIKDIPSDCTAVGCPAIIIKRSD